jgi:glyoxylase-like metal-dependent hydrolase (beta-lactamase superfamily II)
MDGFSDCIACRGRLCCHCLLIETSRGLVLVDTGFGLNDVRHPQRRLSRFFLALLSPDFHEGATAVRQIERLGFSASDVRHIVLTHLDFDHAGGLDDFPLATIHLLRSERDAAMSQSTWLDRQRFRPQQWSSSSRWRTHQPSSQARWMGFDCVRDLPGLPPEILLVPLPGHTLGHAGVAVHDGQRWLLLAGDAYFYHQEMDPTRPWCTPGLRFYQTLMEKDREARLRNQARVRALRNERVGELDVCCSHDLREFDALSGADPNRSAPLSQALPDVRDSPSPLPGR